MTYSEFMAALQQAYEAHPEMEVEQIIAQVVREMGASERCMEDINSSLSLLDKMQEKKSLLEAAHENGNTTKRWILSETDKLTAGRNDEDKAAIAEGIAKAVDRGVQHDRHHRLNLYPSAPRTRQIRFLS